MIRATSSGLIFWKRQTPIRNSRTSEERNQAQGYLAMSNIRLCMHRSCYARHALTSTNKISPMDWLEACGYFLIYLSPPLEWAVNVGTKVRLKVTLLLETIKSIKEMKMCSKKQAWTPVKWPLFKDENVKLTLHVCTCIRCVLVYMYICKTDSYVNYHSLPLHALVFVLITINRVRKSSLVLYM